MNMVLHINSSVLISDVQKEFNSLFPFLKLEFFHNRSFARSDFSASQLIPYNKKLGENKNNIGETDIEISEDMKVSELESLFKDRFSLAVQVFRKSGNVWLETTMTDNWTLQHQNNHGKEISTGRTNKDESIDYDLNRDND